LNGRHQKIFLDRMVAVMVMVGIHSLVLC
jgi:hypothetical protein